MVIPSVFLYVDLIVLMCAGSVTFSNRTHIFDWCVVRLGSKNNHHIDTVIIEVGLCLQIY